MALNPLERLEKGNVDFFLGMNYRNQNDLIEDIRNTKDNQKIINGFLPLLKDKMPYFCIKIIYDMEEYKEEVFELLRKYSNGDLFYFFELKELMDIFKKTSWGKKMVFQFLDEILEKNLNILKALLDIAFADFAACKPILDKLSLHKDLTIRAGFMLYLVKNHFDKIVLFYEDITKYLTYNAFKESNA